MDDLKIITFNAAYREHFKNLNIDWLEKYFKVEPIDMKVISSPEEIINKGGQIFFALLNGEVVGTCALLRDEDLFELSKMAVTEKAQGKKIGQKLGETAVTYAHEAGVKKIFLESNRKLIPALNLYKKLGFKEVENYKSEKYLRSDIKMELDLN